MNEVIALTFTDMEAKTEGALMVRVKKGAIGLCLSLRTNGDVEVFLSPEDAARLIKALEEAVLIEQSL